MKKAVMAFLFLCSFVSFWGVQAAYAAPNAYIDPNTGGMLFQMLAVAFTLLSGVVFFFSGRIKMGFARLMRMIRGDGPEAPSQDAPPEEE